MPSPFPGMDPYIERPEIWPDFHDSMVGIIRGALQARLKPRYVALLQDRLFVIESNRPIRPDVSIIATGDRPLGGGAQTAVVECDPAVEFEIWEEEIREPLIHIIEPAAENRIVTAIEILSPDNKTGAGRNAYQGKRVELRDSGTHLVEIDLLRGGDAVTNLTDDHLESLRPWHYMVNVIRRNPVRQAVYPVPLARRLPKIAIPLLEGDPDVPLDLQAVFTRCWDEGPYPNLLRYEGPPPGPMTPEDVAWCEGVLRAAGYRPQPHEVSP